VAGITKCLLPAEPAEADQYYLPGLGGTNGTETYTFTSVVDLNYYVYAPIGIRPAVPWFFVILNLRDAATAK
jgi:hypothetical protein